VHFSSVTFADCGLEIGLNANMWVQLEVFWEPSYEQRGTPFPRTKTVCVFDDCGVRTSLQEVLHSRWRGATLQCKSHISWMIIN